MKQFFVYIMATLTLGFAACSEDESEVPYFETAQLVGNWCMVGDAGEIIEMSITKSHSVNGSMYQSENGILKTIDTFTGSWVCYPENSILVFQILHTKTGLLTTVSYAIDGVDPTTLQLRNQKLGNQETYHKLALSENVFQGEQINVSNAIQDFIPTSFSSFNQSIVSIDADGNVTANKAGTTYLLAENGTSAFFIKICVESRISAFAKEMLMTIDEVLASHGKPDVEGKLVMNQAILYSQSNTDPALSNVQYTYDEITREITRIDIYYQSEESFYDDDAFIKASFFDFGNGTYGEWEEYMSNIYVVGPYATGNSLRVTFLNQEYLKRTGYVS